MSNTKIRAMQLKRMYKSFIVGAGFTVLSSFTDSTGIVNNSAIKMPYKKYGYSERQAAARLLDRFTFGAKPGQIDEVLKMGIDQWMEQQLEGTLPDSDLTQRFNNYETLALDNETIVNTYMNAGQVVRFAAKHGLIDRDTAKGDNKKEYQETVRQLMLKEGFKPIVQLQSELINQKIIRAAYSNNQLHELLTDFWFNHFNVSLTKPQCQQYILTYERDAIRPNVTGNFETILEATAKHPAMLEYLDNANSVSNNNSVANKRGNAFVDRQMKQKADEMMATNPTGAEILNKTIQARKVQGLNENYAREIMELHTMGVDAGYTQEDVTSVARALTGWSVRPMIKDAPGRNLYERAGKENLEKRGFVMEGDFLFRADKHDDSVKMILGKAFPENGGYKEGKEVIHLLATSPATAQFICKKLATRFVSDTPSVSLVNHMATTFQKTNGNIKSVLITMVNDPAFWNQKIAREKIKSPFELVISTVRATNADVQQPFQLYNWCNKMGQKIYFYQAPTGFPDRAAYWINTGALLNRMNFGLAFASQKIPGVKFDLMALNNNHEPESPDQALVVYSKILLPERDQAANIQRLSAMVRDNSVADKINQAAEKNSPPPANEMMNEGMMNRNEKGNKSNKEKASKEKEVLGRKNKPITMQYLAGNNTMVAQVTGIIIGSPEFQRK